MRHIMISPDGLLHQLLGSTSFPGEAPLFLVEKPAVRSRISRRGAQALAGDLEDPAFFRRVLRGTREAAVVAAPEARLERIVAAVRAAAPDNPVVVLRDDDHPLPGAITLPLSAIGELVVLPALERASQRAKVERIRDLFRDAERVVILMQDDPDPDAIASALGLRALLGRNRSSAPICTFGRITRPENLAMCRILDIEVEEISPGALREEDRIMMVDVQPAFLEERLERVDLVIDHHPADQPPKARIRDIRPSYGATSTILVEYLRAAEVKISQRLATALLYGIKSDTLGLERGGSRADLGAFSFLYLLANHNALRRIERPELSEAALDALAQGLAGRRVVRGVFFSHLGAVSTGDVIPQFADFGLQAEGVEWSVVSGVVRDALHVSVRNVGHVRSAGDVIRAAFGDLGLAGGHRTMAKAVIPVKDLAGAGVDGHEGRAGADWIVQRFLRALGPDSRG
jgi:nanoRNase/pAp phosphatase (c-di-AMP/oligoRNAs hydrolase)